MLINGFSSLPDFKSHEFFIYLASSSPRRHLLLTQIGVSFKSFFSVLSSHPSVEELELLEQKNIEQESPAHYVKRVSSQKAHWALHRFCKEHLQPAPILTADTAVAIGGKILGKPKNYEDATEILESLSGRTHRVLTAVSLVFPLDKVNPEKSRIKSIVNVSRVTFKRLTSFDISSYLQCNEALDKAGAYAIQGKSAEWVRRIDGSYSGIMGLPLYETARLIKKAQRSWQVS